MRTNKKIDGLRISTYVDEECKKIINSKLKENNATLTLFLETLIKKSLFEESDVDKIYNLTKLNQELYIATNSTYSNLNQIAFALNVALKFNTQEMLSSEDTIKRLVKELRDVNVNIKKLRLLFLQFLCVLNSGNPEQAQRYKQSIYRLQKKTSKMEKSTNESL